MATRIVGLVDILDGQALNPGLLRVGVGLLVGSSLVIQALDSTKSAITALVLSCHLKGQVRGGSDHVWEALTCFSEDDKLS